MFAWFKRFTCLHRELTKWHVVRERLFGPLGFTEGDRQQRECVACGHIQRRRIEEV